MSWPRIEWKTPSCLIDRNEQSVRSAMIATIGDQMTDAQIGLSIATPVIVFFALALYRMGVLQRTGVLSAVLAAVAIPASLYMQR